MYKSFCSNVKFENRVKMLCLVFEGLLLYSVDEVLVPLVVQRGLDHVSRHISTIY
jgi:hypothetical protein